MEFCGMGGEEYLKPTELDSKPVSRDARTNDVLSLEKALESHPNPFDGMQDVEPEPEYAGT
jgi:hypothetical protein